MLLDMLRIMYLRNICTILQLQYFNLMLLLNCKYRMSSLWICCLLLFCVSFMFYAKQYCNHASN